MKVFLAIPLIVSSTAFADSATQTDWSGGPGTPGPVSQWGSAYSSADLTEDLFTGRLVLHTELVPLLTEMGLERPEVVHPCWGDVDLDGYIDLLWVSPGRDSLAWFDNPGDPTQPWPRQHIATCPGIISVAFMDRTDSPEPVFAVSRPESGYTTVYCYGITPSGWEETVLGDMGDSDYMTTVSAADLDGNGITEVVGVMWAYDEIRIWWNHDPYWLDVLNGPHCPVRVRAFDGDGDGDMELAVFREYYPVTEILWNYSSSWGNQGWLVDIYYCDDLDAGDVDGDGMAEIAAANGTAWLCNYTSYWDSEQMPGGGEDCAMVDIDRDLATDMMFLDQSAASVFLNTEYGWLHTGMDLPGSFDVLDRLDFDGDGSDEILISDCSTGMTLLLDGAEREYSEEGSLLSSILYVGNDPDWTALSCSATVPAGASIRFQVRASDDPASMGAWSDTLTAPCPLHGILADNASYVQYRAIMTTTDPDTTPALLEVTITWDPLGIGGDPLPPVQFELSPVTPNPSTGSPSIEFGLPEPGPVELLLFDISGRLVEMIAPAEYQAGWHTIRLDEMAPGIYFVRMRAGEFEAAERFAVVE